MPRGQSCDHRQNFHIPDNIASFPGPTQLSVACSTEKQGEPGIFSHEHDIINGKNFQNKQLCFAYCSTDYTLNARCIRQLSTDTCGKLPSTLALFAVLGPMHPHTIKPFLPSFLS